MMLTETEQAEAFSACWQPSFVGLAILNKNMEFVSANPHTYQILDVTPAEIIGRSMLDIFDIDQEKLNQENAEMLKSGRQKYYIMKRTFEQTQKPVLCMIYRLPQDGVKPFQKYLCQMTLEAETTQETIAQQESFFGINPKLYTSASAMIGGVLVYIWEYFNGAPVP